MIALGIRAVSVVALLGVVACNTPEQACGCSLVPTPDGGAGIGSASGEYAVIQGPGGKVWLVDTDSEVVDEYTLPGRGQASQPAPGTVVVLGTDAWRLDLASGKTTTVPVRTSPGARLEDGQRIVLETRRPEPDGDVAEVQPGPETVVGAVDMLAGERLNAQELAGSGATVLDRTGDAVLLEVPGSENLAVLRLDTALAPAVELPTANQDDVHLSDDGHTAAVTADGRLWAGDTTRDLVDRGAAELDVMGVVGSDVLLRGDAGAVRMARDGARTAVAGFDPGMALVGPHGLLAVDDGEGGWFRLDGDRIVPIPGATGKALVAHGPEAWWFGPDEDSTTLADPPLLAVATTSGRVRPVTGSLENLAALVEGTTLGNGRFLQARRTTATGGSQVVLANARTGAVVHVEQWSGPVALSSDGTHAVSDTVQGPTITTLGETVEITPVFDLDLEQGQSRHRWVRSA